MPAQPVPAEGEEGEQVPQGLPPGGELPGLPPGMMDPGMPPLLAPAEPEAPIRTPGQPVSRATPAPHRRPSRGLSAGAAAQSEPVAEPDARAEPGTGTGDPGRSR
jgi:preprotein translocase subunit SecD